MSCEPTSLRRDGAHTIAVGLVALLLLALTVASASQSASPVTLPSRDTEDLVITIKDLPDFPRKTSHRSIRNDRQTARVLATFTSDESAAEAAGYPSLMKRWSIRSCGSSSH